MEGSPSRKPLLEPTLVSSLAGHSKTVTGVAHCAEDKIVFSCSEDKEVRAWRGDRTLASYKCKHPCTAIAYLPERDWVIVGLESGFIVILDLDDDEKNFNLVNSIDAHRSRVSGICVDNDHAVIVSVGHDKAIRVYDIANSELYGGKISSAYLTTVAYDSRTARAFVGTFSQEILIVDVVKRPPVVIHAIKGHKGSIRSMSYVPDREWIFSGSFDLTVKLFEVGTAGQENHSRVLDTFQPHKKKIKAVAFAREINQVLSAGDDKGIYVWDVSSQNLSTVLKDAHKGEIVGCVWDGEDRTLITCSKDKTVKVWSFNPNLQATPTIREEVATPTYVKASVSASKIPPKFEETLSESEEELDEERKKPWTQRLDLKPEEIVKIEEMRNESFYDLPEYEPGAREDTSLIKL